MKKKFLKISLIAVFLVSLLGIILLFVPANSATIISRDWSDMDEDAAKINASYSYSTIFLSGDTNNPTKFIIYKQNDKTATKTYDFDTIKNKEKYTFDITPDDESSNALIMRITNCAVNAAGEMLDVVINIHNVMAFTGHSADGKVQFRIDDGYNTANQNNPAETSGHKVTSKTPLMFVLMASNAQADFTMTYYKAGTYTYNSAGGTGELGNIENINGFYYDIDVVADSPIDDAPFKGNEGIKPQSSSTIYYEKNEQNKNADYAHELDVADGGIRIVKKTGTINVQAVYYESSALILSEANNSSFTFTYSGTNCGINYMYASPYPFQISNPSKSASISEIQSGETPKFNYTISQYIPNNFYGSLFGFGEVYSKLYKTTKYKSVVIEDTIDSKFSIDSSRKITIVDESGASAMNYFTVGTSGNTVTATAKSSTLQNNPDFYSHTYKITVPVVANADISGVYEVCNQATTTSVLQKENEDVSTTDDTNDVCVKIRYTLTVNYYEKGTNTRVDGLQPDITSNLEYNATPDTDYKKVDTTTKWQISSAETDAGVGEYKEDPTSHVITDVNIKKNTTVNYYFEKHKYNLTVKYLEEGTNNTVADQDGPTTYAYGDDYNTSPAKGENVEWEYTGHYEGVPNGTITGDTVVTYYFQKKKYNLTVHYLEYGTNKPIDTMDGINPKVTNSIPYGTDYSTDYNNVNLKKWQIVSSNVNITQDSNVGDGQKISGKIRGETVVNYYFTKIPYTLTVNYYEKGTTTRVDGLEPDNTNPIYYDDHYDTNYNKVNLKKWRIVSSEVKIDNTVTSAEDGSYSRDNSTQIVNGELRGNTIVNYYFEKIPYTLTVNYYGIDQFESTSVIEEAKITNPIYYDDTYGPDDNYGIDYNKTNINFKKWRILRSEVKPAKPDGEVEYTKAEKTHIVNGTIRGDTVVNYYFELIPYPVTVNYYDADTHEEIAEKDETIYYYDMLYYTDYDKINMDVWEYVSTDGDPINGRITGDQESYTINYYFNRLKYELVVNYYDDETKEKIDRSDRAAYNYGDEYDTNYDKIDENYWEYVRTEGETPGVITEDKEVDYYFNNKEYTLEVNYYDEETGEKIEETDISSHKFGEEYTTNDDKIDKKKWELVEEPENKEGTIEDDTEVNYYYRRRKYKITVNYYEEETEDKIIESREYEAYYEDKYITDYNGVDEDVWTLVGMPDNYQGEVDGDIVVNYYFKQVVIENPPTGENQNNIPIVKIVVTISVMLVLIVFTYRILLKRKIFKI